MKEPQIPVSQSEENSMEGFLARCPDCKAIVTKPFINRFIGLVLGLAFGYITGLFLGTVNLTNPYLMALIVGKYSAPLVFALIGYKFSPRLYRCKTCGKYFVYAQTVTER